jgi:hypothetical protein
MLARSLAFCKQALVSRKLRSRLENLVASFTTCVRCCSDAVAIWHKMAAAAGEESLQSSFASTSLRPKIVSQIALAHAPLPRQGRHAFASQNLWEG